MISQELDPDFPPKSNIIKRMTTSLVFQCCPKEKKQDQNIVLF